MSRPKNKYERLLISKRKGYKRVSQWFEVGSHYNRTVEETFEKREKHARHHRNLTKVCAKGCCANPRKYLKEVTLKEKSFAEKQKLLDFK